VNPDLIQGNKKSGILLTIVIYRLL